MEKINIIAFAAPAFFIFLYLEYQYAKYKKQQKLFKYESSVSNTTIGIAERLLNLFVTASFYGLFVWIYDNYRLFTISDKWYIWILLLLAADFVWYWYHRLGHEINIFWAAHIVHHQSEEFNFSAAARITTIQAFIRTGFWCVLPFIGFQPMMVMGILVAHGMYSFFTHTQVIKAPKWLEYVFITPSLHGVHHASNEKYLDKNYGDVFVFWDKMFGTFQAEEEQPKYGLTHPIGSYSFLWQHFHYYLEIYEATKKQNGFWNKMKIVFGSPAIMDQHIRPELEKKFFQKNTNRETLSPTFKKYINIQLFIVAFVLTLFSAFYAYFDEVEKTAVAILVLISLINIGALLEQRKWIYYLEYSRVILLISLIFYEFGYTELIYIPILTLILLEQKFKLKNWYLYSFLDYENTRENAG